MEDLQKNPAEKYQEFFNFINENFNLILTLNEMDEIIFEVQRLIDIQKKDI